MLLINIPSRFLLRHLSYFGRFRTRKGKPLTTPYSKEVTGINPFSLFFHLVHLFQYEFSLTNGSLIVMLGDTQQYWKHSVPKEDTVCGPRINLTFRTIHDK